MATKLDVKLEQFEKACDSGNLLTALRAAVKVQDAIGDELDTGEQRCEEIKAADPGCCAVIERLKLKCAPPAKVDAKHAHGKDVKAAAEEKAIPPELIVQLITLVIGLFQKWREGRG